MKSLQDLMDEIQLNDSKTHRRPLKDFTVEDDRILKRISSRFDDVPQLPDEARLFSVLLGNAEELMYQDPRQYLVELEAKTGEYSQMFHWLKDAAAKGPLSLVLSQLNLSEDLEALSIRFDKVSTFIITLQERAIDNSLAYVKQIGEEQGRHPIDVVKTQAGIDESVRRLFPTRQIFLTYSKNQILLTTKIVEATSKIMEKAINEGVNKIPKIPFISAAIVEPITQTFLDKIKGLPSSTLVQAYGEHKMAIMEKEADRIYKDHS